MRSICQGTDLCHFRNPFLLCCPSPSCSSQLTGVFSRPWLWLFLRKILEDLKLDPKYSVSLWLTLPRSCSRICGGRAKLIVEEQFRGLHPRFLNLLSKVSMWGGFDPCPPWEFQCFPASVGTGTAFLHPCSSQSQPAVEEQKVLL